MLNILFPIRSCVSFNGIVIFVILDNLKELRISPEYELHGDRLFIEKEKCLYSIALPSSIENINGKEVEITKLTNYTIPSTATSIDNDCFSLCYKLTQLIIPETFINIQRNLFSRLPELEELTMSNEYELHGDRLFIVKDNCLESIELPKSIKKVLGRW